MNKPFLFFNGDDDQPGACDEPGDDGDVPGRLPL